MALKFNSNPGVIRDKTPGGITLIVLDLISAFHIEEEKVHKSNKHPVVVFQLVFSD